MRISRKFFCAALTLALVFGPSTVTLAQEAATPKPPAQQDVILKLVPYHLDNCAAVLFLWGNRELPSPNSQEFKALARQLKEKAGGIFSYSGTSVLSYSGRPNLQRVAEVMQAHLFPQGGGKVVNASLAETILFARLVHEAQDRKKQEVDLPPIPALPRLNQRGRVKGDRL